MFAATLLAVALPTFMVMVTATTQAAAQAAETSGTTIRARVFLQGAYDGAGRPMKTTYLKYLPANQPYGGAPWRAPATTVPRVATNADGFGLAAVTATIVDWVLVELRTTARGAGADAGAGAAPLASRAALLLSNGDVVGVDTSASAPAAVARTDGVHFAAAIDDAQDLYVLIHHRNHLSIMSPAPVAACADGDPDGGAYCIDFTRAQSYRNGQYALRGGRGGRGGPFAMHAGDTNRDGVIDDADRRSIRAHNLTTIGAGHYDEPDAAGRYVIDSDLDFDGDVLSADGFFIVGRDAVRGGLSRPSSDVAGLAAEVEICRNPAAAFATTRSATNEHGDYWVAYRCREVCDDWRQCLQRSGSRQDLAFVVDDMGGRLRFSVDRGGDEVLYLQRGVGGISFMPILPDQIERASSAGVVMVAWESGFRSWGWFTRTAQAATRVPRVTRRIAAIIAWVHENLAGDARLGTVGCSMGAQATFGAVYWHGIDEAVDYQLFIGGPALWDINAGCGRRTYASGHCDRDPGVACTSDADCRALGANSRCDRLGPIYRDNVWLYEQVVNHVHATTACDVSQAQNRAPLASFDESGFAFTDGDWDFDHPVDFAIDLQHRRGADGDEDWALSDMMRSFNGVTSQAGHAKRWLTKSNARHCNAAHDGRALDLIRAWIGP